MCLIRWFAATLIFLTGLIMLAVSPTLAVLLLMAWIIIPRIVRKLGG